MEPEEEKASEEKEGDFREFHDMDGGVRAYDVQS